MQQNVVDKNLAVGREAGCVVGVPGVQERQSGTVELHPVSAHVPGRPPTVGCYSRTNTHDGTTETRPACDVIRHQHDVEGTQAHVWK